MDLEDYLKILFQNKKVSVRENDDEIVINLNGDVLVVYLKEKSAEFLDIDEDDWNYLPWALEEKYYKEIPELRFFYEYLRQEKYKIKY
jgi:hypothetical protein